MIDSATARPHRIRPWGGVVPGIRLGRLLFVLCCGISAQIVSGQATDPQPANGTANADLNTSLTWTAPAGGADEYDVYFGLSNPPAFQSRVTIPQFRLETLRRNVTYFWRIDARSSGELTTGTLWNFMTEPAATQDEMYRWPVNITLSIFDRYPTANSFALWNYEEGLLLGEVYRLAKTLGNQPAWITRIRTWLDRSVTAGGNISLFAFDPDDRELDDVGPGKLLLWIYQETGTAKYNNAATYLSTQHVALLPRTSDNGYWHKNVYPYQMWLDGLYMAGPFNAFYAQERSETAWFDEAAFQLLLIATHTKDPVTGLFYHGWHDANDPGTVPPWADPVTGASPEFWGRAIGWYGMALVDVLDWLPANHADHAAIVTLLQDYSAALLPYQDAQTGMWFQVVDKGNLSDNWVESSATAMFGYTLAKGVQQGYLNNSYLAVAQRAFRGLLNNKVATSGAHTVDLTGTVQVGTLNPATPGAGTYDYYVNVPRVNNDKKGVGPFLGLAHLLAKSAELNQSVDVRFSGFVLE